MKNKLIRFIATCILIAIYFVLSLNNSSFIPVIEGYCVGICSGYIGRKFADCVTKTDK